MTSPADFSLDDLLAESLDHSAKIKQAKSLTKMAKLGKINEVDAKTLREMELLANWKMKFRTEFHPYFVCDCGHEFSFYDYFAIEYHDRAGNRRWITDTEGEGAYLPLKRIYKTTEVSSCSMCDEGAEEAIEESWQE